MDFGGLQMERIGLKEQEEQIIHSILSTMQMKYGLQGATSLVGQQTERIGLKEEYQEAICLAFIGYAIVMVYGLQEHLNKAY